jgi:hypothetical protein
MWSILLKLPQLISCTGVPPSVLAVELNNHRVISVQRYLLLYGVGKLEKG